MQAFTQLLHSRHACTLTSKSFGNIHESYIRIAIKGKISKVGTKKLIFMTFRAVLVIFMNFLRFHEEKNMFLQIFPHKGRAPKPQNLLKT
jgi:hypothetical protein